MSMNAHSSADKVTNHSPPARDPTLSIKQLIMTETALSPAESADSPLADLATLATSAIDDIVDNDTSGNSAAAKKRARPHASDQISPAKKPKPTVHTDSDDDTAAMATVTVTATVSERLCRCSEDGECNVCCPPRPHLTARLSAHVDEERTSKPLTAAVKTIPSSSTSTAQAISSTTTSSLDDRYRQLSQLIDHRHSPQQAQAKLQQMGLEKAPAQTSVTLPAPALTHSSDIASAIDLAAPSRLLTASASSSVAVAGRSDSAASALRKNVCFYSFCGQRCNSEDSLIIHLLSQHDDTHYRCKACPQAFDDLGHRGRHALVAHAQQRPHHCQRCGEEFYLNDELLQHRDSRCKYTHDERWNLPATAVGDHSSHGSDSGEGSVESDDGMIDSDSDALDPPGHATATTAVSQSSANTTTRLTASSVTHRQTVSFQDLAEPAWLANFPGDVLPRPIVHCHFEWCNRHTHPFSSESECVAHVRAAHDTLDYARCKYCVRKFSARSDLHRHISLQHSDRPSRWCWLCGKSWSDVFRGLQWNKVWLDHQQHCPFLADGDIGLSKSVHDRNHNENVVSKSLAGDGYRCDGENDGESMEANEQVKNRRIATGAGVDDRADRDSLDGLTPQMSRFARIIPVEDPLLHCFYLWCDRHINGFSSEDQCAAHIAAQHPVGENACYVCRAQFKTSSELYEHMGFSHPSWPRYHCRRCGKRSMDKRGVKGIVKHGQNCRFRGNHIYMRNRQPKQQNDTSPLPSTEKDDVATECETSQQSDQYTHAHGDDRKEDAPMTNNANASPVSLRSLYSRCFYPYCSSVNSRFATFAQFKHHVLTKHNPMKQINCLHCPHSFDHRSGELQHFTRHHSAEQSRWFCHFCGQRFESFNREGDRSSLRRHICPLRHPNTGEFVADVPEEEDTDSLRRTNANGQLAKRERDHSHSSGEMREALHEAATERAANGEQPDQSAAAERASKGDQKDQSLYSCVHPRCSACFTSPAAYVSHIDTKHTAALHRCHHCTKNFGSRDALVGHYKSSHPLNDEAVPWTCHYCANLLFETVDELNDHRRHCSLRQYCEKAVANSEESIDSEHDPSGKADESNGTSTRHSDSSSSSSTSSAIGTPIKSGNGWIELGVCDDDDVDDDEHLTPTRLVLTCYYRFCAKRFNREIDCIKHIRKAHDSTVLRCLDCTQTFTHRRPLNQHVSSFHAACPNWCQGCGQTFQWVEKLKKHRCRILYEYANLSLEDAENDDSNADDVGKEVVEMNVEGGENIDDSKSSVTPRRSSRRTTSKSFTHDTSTNTDTTANTSSSGASKNDSSSPTAWLMQCFYESCGETFLTEADTISHLKSVHPMRAFQCKYCGESQPSAWHRGRHCSKKHPGRNSRFCWLCGADFWVSHEVARHKCRLGAEREIEEDDAELKRNEPRPRVSLLNQVRPSAPSPSSSSWPSSAPAMPPKSASFPLSKPRQSAPQTPIPWESQPLNNANQRHSAHLPPYGRPSLDSHRPPHHIYPNAVHVPPFHAPSRQSAPPRVSLTSRPSLSLLPSVDLSQCFYSYCSAQLPSTSAFYRHIVSDHHPSQLHHCRECHRSFSLRGGLTLHCESEHPELTTPYWCSWCGEYQLSLAALANHMQQCLFCSPEAIEAFSEPVRR